MKKKELERKLRELGWRFERHGGRHDIWSNGYAEEAVPRHNEITETTAKIILKRAAEYPPLKEDLERG
jgi:mRNA interferase HicA